jgi:hypothetical protein
MTQFHVSILSGFDGFTGHIVNRAYNIAPKAGMHGFSKALGRETFAHTELFRF